MTAGAGNAAVERPEVGAGAPGRVIVDAHHHVWDLRNPHPWLRDEPPPAFRYGDSRPLRRDYGVADYLDDAAPWTVAASVYVEAEWDPGDPCGEMDHIARVREREGLPSVAVAAARLDAADPAPVLERHAARGFVRSVRHKPRANPSPRDAAPGGLTDPAFREGFARLGRLGLRFDLQTPWWHLHEAAALARAHPDTAIVLNHAGLPSDRSPEGLAGWREGLRALAGVPGASVKISGLGQPGRAWTSEANRGVVLTTIETFGADRCMFASNFPVDGLCGTFAAIFAGFEAIVGDFTRAERDALFAGNARRLYDIPEAA